MANAFSLFHGSHSGISGEILATKSRSLCDFGTGFYTGDNELQAKTIIAEDDGGVFYELSADLSNLSVYEFKNNLEWAFVIGAYRNHIDKEQYPKLKSLISEIEKFDVIKGLIANDRMAYVYTQFVTGAITDVVLQNALQYVHLGNQYVFKTNEACKNIKIISSKKLAESERKDLLHEKHKTIGTLKSDIEELQRKYRRDGRFIDELLDDWR